LALFLATTTKTELRDAHRAILLARQAISAGGETNPVAFEAFAASQAATGDRSGAIQTIERLLQSSENAISTTMRERLESRLTDYRNPGTVHD
jgi:hypothetical protein